ncbi:hypothetical protein WJX74_006452 [Apatococcus lobatus]|uniref:Uncharacterized protein n=1 Tax=Apatococcus lobatus TaxID=904363 RepID=A0AAW1SAW8_9CHLO
MYTDLQVEQEIELRLLSVSGATADLHDIDSDDDSGAASWSTTFKSRPTRGPHTRWSRPGVDATLAQLGKGNKLIAEATGLLLNAPEALTAAHLEDGTPASPKSDEESELQMVAEAFTGSKRPPVQSSSSLNSVDSLRSSQDGEEVDSIIASQQLQQHRAQDKVHQHVQLLGPETPPTFDTVEATAASNHAPAVGSLEVNSSYSEAKLIGPASVLHQSASHLGRRTDAWINPAGSTRPLQLTEVSKDDQGPKMLATVPAAGPSVHHMQTAAVEESLQLKLMLERQASEWVQREAAREGRERELRELTFHYARKYIAAGRIWRAWRRYSIGPARSSRLQAVTLIQAHARRRCAQKQAAKLQRQQNARHQLECAGKGTSLEAVKLAVQAAQSLHAEADLTWRIVQQTTMNALRRLNCSARLGSASDFMTAMAEVCSSDAAGEVAEAKKLFEERVEQAEKDLSAASSGGSHAVFVAAMQKADNLGIGSETTSEATRAMGMRQTKASSDLESCIQANPFSIRTWDSAQRAAAELGLAQQAKAAACKLQERKATLILALQKMNDAGLQIAQQASGLCKEARSLGLAGEAVAAERSWAKQRASADAHMHAASTGTSARAFEDAQGKATRLGVSHDSLQQANQKFQQIQHQANQKLLDAASMGTCQEYLDARQAMIHAFNAGSPSKMDTALSLGCKDAESAAMAMQERRQVAAQGLGAGLRSFLFIGRNKIEGRSSMQLRELQHAAGPGGLREWQSTIEAAIAAQHLTPAECQRAAWRQAMQPLDRQLKSFHALPPELSSDQHGLPEALETAWAVGLQDNTVAALHTLLRWIQDAQQVNSVMMVDLSRHPDSLPWDCEIDSADPDPWSATRHESVSGLRPSEDPASQDRTHHLDDKAVTHYHSRTPVLDLLQAEVQPSHSSPAPVRPLLMPQPPPVEFVLDLHASWQQQQQQQGMEPHAVPKMVGKPAMQPGGTTWSRLSHPGMNPNEIRDTGYTSSGKPAHDRADISDDTSAASKQPESGAAPLPRMLDLDSERLSNLSEHRQLHRHLVHLSANQNRLSHVSGLSDVSPDICHLSLQMNQLTSLTGLSSMSSLRILHVGHNQLKSLNGLPLRTSSVDACCNQIERLMPAVQTCCAITKLHLSNNQLSSLQGLATCSSLQHLDVSGNRLRSLAGLGSCSLLQNLAADGNMLEAFPSQQHLPTALLVSLSLKANRISVLPSLPWLPHLQELNLQDNEVICVQPMLSCAQLTALDLSFNAIADLDSIAAISPCTRLRSLSLNDNPATELPGYADMRLQAVCWLRADELADQAAAGRAHQAFLEDKNRLQATHLSIRDVVFDCNEDAALRYEALMHLLHTQTAQRASLEELYRLRRAPQKCGHEPARPRTRTGWQVHPAAASWLHEMCPLEAERLRGPGHLPALLEQWQAAAWTNLLQQHHAQLLRPHATAQVTLHGLDLKTFRNEQEGKRLAAAVRFQAAWRGRCSRLTTRKLLTEANHKRQSVAATCIQAAFRGHLVRQHIAQALQRARRRNTSQPTAPGSEGPDNADASDWLSAEAFMPELEGWDSTALPSINRPVTPSSVDLAQEFQDPSMSKGDRAAKASETSAASHSHVPAGKRASKCQLSCSLHPNTQMSAEAHQEIEEELETCQSHADSVSHTEQDDQNITSSLTASSKARHEARITEMMQEWGIQDRTTAESLFRSRQRQLRQQSSSKLRAKMQDPEARLQRFKASSSKDLPTSGSPKMLKKQPSQSAAALQRSGHRR